VGAWFGTTDDRRIEGRLTAMGEKSRLLLLTKEDYDAIVIALSYDTWGHSSAQRMLDRLPEWRKLPRPEVEKP